ncbi:GH1 family beta-glucosidase [Pleomorphomonas sp. NRK KF1]|uniref:GH1 family beta-glucosidase n=1 Tax=Pleomorphomonas sp. NRK KF1 TaxID=2943000 RepID=UPI0020444AE0|nr:GH1 family beta-glucosidase [Pleomorphomonas sp. NRK KF1]MCM5553668.1 GH1 family beta-glucosidase [Pleomorphomonas sp. NRK KF1]
MSNAALSKRFPREFVFGYATAAYQIEGAHDEDGRKPSIWDAFSRIPGRVRNGDTGDVACDHYHRMPEDVRLLRSLSADAYRFSIAWPRVIPDGRGPVNEKGIDFYDRLIDELLKAEIKPYATLYHWDLPIEQHGRGGWCARDTAYAFADYTDVVMARLGDRLSGIMTLNEPWCSGHLSYLIGEHAPGERNLTAALASIHTLNLAHGLAMQAIKARRADLPSGIVYNAKALYPASGRPEDIAATERYRAFHDGVFMDPVFLGHYPADVLDAFGPIMPTIEPDDLKIISTPIDFLGLNFYAPERIVADPALPFPRARSVQAENVPRTAMGWEIHAPALDRLLTDLDARYKLPPIYIAENGCAQYDELIDGKCDDPGRIDYLDKHLTVLADARDKGIRVDGYFVWSLMDNYEWSHGYAKRFGVVYVDYETQVRTPKSSALWYRDLIAGRAQAASV